MVSLYEVELSRHALKRAEERGVPIGWVINTVNRPLETVEVKFGRRASSKHFDCSYIVAVYETRKDKILVVTLVRVDKERLKRYGFTRI